MRLVVVRRGNPLCFSETPGGFYFASLPAGLPGKTFSIADDYAGLLGWHGGGLRHDVVPLPAAPQAETPAGSDSVRRAWRPVNRS